MLSFPTYLNEFTKTQTYVAQFSNQPQKIGILKHTIVQTIVQKVLMYCQHFVNIFHAFDFLHKCVPRRFDDFDHHVVFDVLYGVHHALT